MRSSAVCEALFAQQSFNRSPSGHLRVCPANGLMLQVPLSLSFCRITPCSAAEPRRSNTATMASHGAALQTQNNELVKCIEDLREKREILRRNIREDEAEKVKIQQDLQTLTKRLAQINDSLSTKHGAITDYEKIIHETEQAYSKIVESSHTLLSVLKKEASSIGKRATPTEYHHA